MRNSVGGPEVPSLHGLKPLRAPDVGNLGEREGEKESMSARGNLLQADFIDCPNLVTSVSAYERR